MGGGRGTMHAGILGKPRMGKSSLGKYFCRLFTEAGRETLVYDLTLSDEEVEACNKQVPDAEWHCTFCTNNQEVFLEVFFQTFDVVAFVDEATEAAGRHNSEMIPTATRGSHQDGQLGAGSSLFYMAHGYTELNRTLRGQLYEFYIFRVAKESAVDLANEFDHPQLRFASRLMPLEFYHVGGAEPLTKWRFDFEKMAPVLLETFPQDDENE